MKLIDLYELLLKQYGRQGWWPLLCDDSPEGRFTCYHIGNYDIPQDDEQRLEICLGAILTQNTNWLNVEKALFNLKSEYLMTASALAEINHIELAQYIKPSGYYNQKARKLQEFCRFYMKLNGRRPARDELLAMWGIGPETADSMLLYGWKQPVMVIDAYTRRIFKAEGFPVWNARYDELRFWCQQQLPADYILLQEFHALLVEAGKRVRDNETKV
jgi:endonuclease-3 related protein